MKGFSKRDIHILTSLGHYSFLDYDQMIRLGITTYKSNLSSSLNKLAKGDRPYISKIPHGFGEKAIFYLRARGKHLLAKLDFINDNQCHHQSKYIDRDTQDRKHRSYTIDLHIEMERTLSVLKCFRYFDKRRSNELKDISLSCGIVPDILLQIQTPKQKEYYFIEIENGPNPQKSIEKCLSYAKAQLNGSFNHALNFDSGIRSLWVFEKKSTCKKVIESIQRLNFFSNLYEYFLFKTFDQINGQDFINNWINIERKKRAIY